MISTPKTLLSALLLLSASLHVSAENLKARWDKGSHQYQDAPSVKEHWILVGPDGKLEFVPPYIHIPVGDTVVFQFRPKNHTVTQSSFDNPCMSNGGFKSGFMPVDPSVQEGDLPTFKIKVENNDPIWGYCGQVNHCQSGMVFAINPDQNSDKTFENFLTIAKGGKSGDKEGGDANAWPTTTATPDYGGPTYTSTGMDGMTTTYTNPSGNKTHRITVGADGKLEYAPNNIKADVGDFVIFQFKPKNHTVTRSSFENPCQSNGGFKSGFRPVAADAQHFPTFTIKVHDVCFTLYHLHLLRS
ncbi:Cupredoxin [Ephemerocybe angulata]|uniref:Cupredoxin n=1 Tax=Ephemerocybe angulata TaxID=980116 RepID=A0A8H6I8Q4_9AGAR|nr:Cupredoxin [Tulosesus angulatus]